jgi:ankyrin repeat protein
MFAAQEGYCKMIDILLEKGVDVNAETELGATALWLASQHGHTAAVQKLLDADAKSFAAKSNGRYPVHQAAQNAHFEVVKLLVEKDPSCVTLKDHRGTSLMSLASFGRETVRVDILEYLTGKGLSVVDEE